MKHSSVRLHDTLTSKTGITLNLAIYWNYDNNNNNNKVYWQVLKSYSYSQDVNT